MPKTSTVLAFSIAALTAAAATAYKMGNSCSASTKTNDKELLNSAFVFVKPQANTEATQQLVRSKLTEAGITIVSECDVSGEKIDSEKLIDQHYYAIASKATLLNASEIPVPADKFEETFGEKWEDVLKADRACNALQACEKWKCTPEELNEVWQKAKITKFGGGFYCGYVTMGNSSLYVFNAFFMTMRSKFVGKGTSIHCFSVEWSPKTLSWSDFRNKLLGPTDPAEGPEGSIRKTILDSYKELGIASQPNKGDNGVHASASPLEGLAEKTNWLKASIADDAFGKALLNAGVKEETIKAWSIDPQINYNADEKGSIFDAVEDMDVEECFKKLLEFNACN